MLLTPADLIELTGYRQPRRQLRWLAERLKITPPRWERKQRKWPPFPAGCGADIPTKGRAR